jgi:hypothetical protein
MNICINKILTKSKNLNPKLQQWLWFIGLWIAGLASVVAITIPIKLLVRACQ